MPLATKRNLSCYKTIERNQEHRSFFTESNKPLFRHPWFFNPYSFAPLFLYFLQYIFILFPEFRINPDSSDDPRTDHRILTTDNSQSLSSKRNLLWCIKTIERNQEHRNFFTESNKSFLRKDIPDSLTRIPPCHPFYVIYNMNSRVTNVYKQTKKKRSNNHQSFTSNLPRLTPHLSRAIIRYCRLVGDNGPYYPRASRNIFAGVKNGGRIYNSPFRNKVPCGRKLPGLRTRVAELGRVFSWSAGKDASINCEQRWQSENLTPARNKPAVS